VKTTVFKANFVNREAKTLCRDGEFQLNAKLIALTTQTKGILKWLRKSKL
jgi:hypothetical protein